MEIYSLKDSPADKDDDSAGCISNRKDNIISDSCNNTLKITNLKPALKNKNRVNVFVNEKYEFSLDLAQVVDYKIKVGTILTPKKLNELKNASEFGKLYQRTLEWVLSRPRSVKETRDYLEMKLKKRESENRLIVRNCEKLKAETKEERASRKIREEKYGTYLKTKELPLFSKDDIEKIIDRLTEREYLDDYRFAEYYLENRNVKKGTSLKKIKLELAKKGVSQPVVEEILSRNVRNDEEEIKKIIIKKRRKYDDQKLIQYLVRQGFDFQLAQAAVSETDSQNSA